MSEGMRISSTMIPSAHRGMDYKTFNAALSRKRSSLMYMEIGVQNGHHLAGIATERAVAIDPEFNINVNVISGKTALEIYQMTSDAFFARRPCHALTTGRLDLAFLDGMHVFEFLLRDFYNVERLSSRNALITLHDCLPLNAEMADRSVGRAIERGRSTKFPNYWTGDVWKIVPILKKYRPDLKIVGVDCAPTGLVCVTNLDADSKVLEEKYLSIVDEFSQTSNDESSISDMYSQIILNTSSDIMRDFDHSLYFRV